MRGWCARGAWCGRALLASVFVLQQAQVLAFSAPTPSLQRVNCDALVVGGGPAGLAAALMLSKRGYKDIHVIEKNSPAFFEVDKAYLYRIDARGQRLTDLLDVTRRLPDVSVTTAEFLNITVVDSTGTVKTVPAPADPRQQPAYWLPRRVLLQFLLDRVSEAAQGSITVHYNSSVESLGMPASVDDAAGVATLRVVDTGSGGVTEFCSQRVLGCDGLNSKVRLGLQAWAAEKLQDPQRFGLQEIDSVSAGLRYKILTLHSRFPLKLGDATLTDPMTCYSYVGTKPQGLFNLKPPLRLGCLPYKQRDIPRTANIIAWPQSEVFKLSTGEQVTAFLKQQFPQCDIEAMVSREEAERFAKSKGGYFPKPQYCRTLYQSIGGGRGGVVLLGDAIHAFPPDLGAGVNSAFDDVFDFNTVLERSADDWGKALPEYQDLRLPQAQAICKLIPIGWPHQYSHMPIRKNFKFATVMLRLALSRVLPKFVAPPVFFMIQDCRLNYADVLRRATRTTRLFQALASLALSLVLWKVFGVPRGPSTPFVAKGI